MTLRNHAKKSKHSYVIESHILNHIELEKAQLGLGHNYNRANVKFNVNRVDNMIIQAISLLDTLDKDINTFCKRVRYCKFKLSSIVFIFFWVLYETTFKIVQSGSILTAIFYTGKNIRIMVRYHYWNRPQSWEHTQHTCFLQACNP